MRRWKLSVGILAAAIASIASFAVSTASARTLEECREFAIGVTFTNSRWANSNCSVPETNGTWTEEVLPSSAKIKALKRSNFKLISSPLGIENEIECTTIGGEAVVTENGKGTIAGEGKTNFTGCTVLKPSGCKVKEPIETVQLTAKSEDLAGEVMKTLFTPKEGTTFTTITYSECGLLNGGHNVQGKARSVTVDTHSSEFNTGKEELTFAGAEARLTGKYHWVTAANGIVLSETTP